MKRVNLLSSFMRKVVITSLVLGLSACGGGSSDNNDEQTNVDTEAPTISLTGSNEITLTVGDTYSDEGATVEDNIDDDITVTTSGSVDTSTIGSYTITYNATDAAGNNANEVTRTVTIEADDSNTPVADITAPTISLTGASEITITAGDDYNDAGATADDNVDQTIDVTTSGIVDNNTVGTYVLTYNATDAAGNNASPVTRTIIVTAVNNPVAVVPPVLPPVVPPVIPPANLVGVFEDSRVIGLNYETPTLSGETDEKGQFEYKAGETVTFRVGDIVLGSAPGAPKVTTFEIGDSLDKDPNSGEFIDVNRAILLQSLDNNQNPADGFIDLTGVVINPNSDVDIEDGVTQADLDLITGEISSAPLISPSQAVAHADISKNNAIEESVGVLKLNTILTQEDIDAGNYRVQSAIGHEFIAVEPTSSTPILSIESDLTALSQAGLDQGRLRNSMVIDNSTDTYYLGLGIRYRDGAYGLNYYVERYGKGQFASEYENYPSEILPAFNDVIIEENISYNFKLEYDVSLDKVFAYIDSVKVLTWDFNTDPRSDDDVVTVRAHAETRAQSTIDPTTGAGTTVGAAIMGTVDNLIVNFDGQTLLSDDFNDNDFSNPDFNYAVRTLRAGNVDVPPTAFDDITSGQVTFKDINANIVQTPTDAWVRIIASRNQISGEFDGLNCKIASDGTFGSECYSYLGEEELRSVFNDSSETFQIIVYAETTGDFEFNPEENQYGFLGNDVAFGSWANIEINIGVVLDPNLANNTIKVTTSDGSIIDFTNITSKTINIYQDAVEDQFVFVPALEARDLNNDFMLELGYCAGNGGSYQCNGSEWVIKITNIDTGEIQGGGGGNFTTYDRPKDGFINGTFDNGLFNGQFKISDMAINVIESIAITSELLTQSPLYIVENDGECNGKFTYNADGTLVIDYLDDDTAEPMSLGLTYSIDSDGALLLVFPSDFIVDGSPVGNQKYTLNSITPTLTSTVLNMTLVDNFGTSNLSGFQNYDDAIAYAAQQGNSNCSNYIPE